MISLFFSLFFIGKISLVCLLKLRNFSGFKSHCRVGKQIKILYAVLDWGLGHAARSVPIIERLQQKGVEVLIASSGGAMQLLRLEFPASVFIELPPYAPIYPENIGMALSMVQQAPRFLQTICKEHKALEKIVKDYSPDGIISDNRYGMYHEAIPSVFMTHQLFIQTPAWLGFLSPLLKWITFQFVRRFTYCWVPDYQDSEQSLSGALSHGDILPANTRFIGWVSRFRQILMPLKYDLLLLLSGPEPQRSVLEKKLVKQLQALTNMKILMIRGVTEHRTFYAPASVVIKDFLAGVALEKAINSSARIISRSGYSTAMDILFTHRPAIFIPTPGQTEQEYLALYWKEKKWFYSESQHRFDLLAAMQQTDGFSPPYHLALRDNNLLEDAIDEFLDLL